MGLVLDGLWGRAAEDPSAPAVSEVTFTAPSGDLRRLSLRVSSWRRKPALFTVTVRDVTELHRRVEELTLEVEALSQEKRRLEDSLRGLVHDVRSPLTGLRGLLAILEQRTRAALPERDSVLVKHCLMAAECLEEVVLGSAGQRERLVTDRPTEVRALVSAVFVELRSANPEVAFTWSAEGPEVRLPVPAHVLWRVLWNLGANAVRYRSPTRALHLVVHTARSVDRCLIELGDNGVGLVPGEEEAIFDKGRRGSNVSTTRGTGLGLHQARGLLKEWDGRVWAEARPVGAAFFISFPFDRS